MSSPAPHVLRPPSGAAAYAVGPAAGADRSGRLARGSYTAAYAEPSPTPQAPGVTSARAVLSVECSRAGFARVRSFTRDTLHAWSLDHHRDDATLVITELAANAATHAAPGSAGAPQIRLGLSLHPLHLLLAVSDPDDNPPVHTPAACSDLLEHGRGLGIVDALSEAWGWTPAPPAGKTVWARLSTCPPT
ncbi:ATP-binding protein [Streptomyces sp. NPDC085946]|uniref:ATP-binding protein n=1 Tax=Streptomyces sp. NPDC085946 TaxID=3365744 RepID=UPI0037D65F83